jgi:aerobic carbon-monoxide dehydrogenase large subunit
MSQPVAQRYTGTPVKRAEDPRILTGRGRYIDDVVLPGMLHATFARSPFPHARITSIDTQAARELPGVVAVFTGAEMESRLQPGPYGIQVLMGADLPAYSALATDKVRLVGDPVALVVAETRYVAEDAAELIEIDYDELAAIASADDALDPSGPAIFEDLGSNVLVSAMENEFGDVDDAFARADRVVRASIAQHRHQNVPMETRGTVASFDPVTGTLEVWTGNQGVAHVQMVLAARLGLPAEQIRVRAQDIGGSFGLKIAATREDVAVAAASRDLGRPVKWIEDRYEHLAFAGQAREESFDVEAAITDEGDILGLKVKMVVDTGAYPGMGAALPFIVQGMFPGPYQIGAMSFEHTVVITNKATYVAYRGPWAAETFVRERLINLIAHELGKEPLEIRLRNVVTRGEEPTHMITGASLDGVTAKESLERMAATIDLAAFRDRQARARAQGRYLGLGQATYIEAAPGVRQGDNALGAEQMYMELAEDGTVVVYTGQMPHGQSHETTTAQIVADQMGVAYEDVRVVVGDTAVVPAGFTGGSRAATMLGGASLTTARALRAKVLDVAAHVLEASPDDLDVADGRVTVRGVPVSAISLAEVAAAAKQPGRIPEGVDTELRVENVYDGGTGGWAGGTHCAVVEVDIETGIVHIERYIVMEDCGELINPAVVDGQVRGGVAQGIGAVLLERSAYDESGNYLTATFMDYLLPTTAEVPRIEIHHLETVPLDRDVNFRGVGEGGMIVAPAALCNAIEDALTPFGVRIHEQHLPPSRLLEIAGVVAPT